MLRQIASERETMIRRAHTNLARQLRRNQTDAEAILWGKLRGRQIDGAKFRRQHSMAGYVLDFYSAELGLCVELDGSQHFDEESVALDAYRTSILKSRGVHVIRFENRRIFQDLDAVLREIRVAVGQRRRVASLAPHPGPLPAYGERE